MVTGPCGAGKSFTTDLAAWRVKEVVVVMVVLVIVSRKDDRGSSYINSNNTLSIYQQMC